ncbi:hypothetical protein GW17_00052409 [Ensete ventricosum]|nr:hypothetical protein GW17_00052409 [Ensete ventricosum]
MLTCFSGRRYGELARVEGHVEACRRASNVRCEGSMGCRDHSLVFLGGLGGSRRSGDKATYQGVSKEPV